MASKLEHYERKKIEPVMLPPTIAKWLEAYGDGNISAGIIEAVRFITDVDALYPATLRERFPRRPVVSRSHEARKWDADHYANWSGKDIGGERPDPALSLAGAEFFAPKAKETETERAARIRRNTEMAAAIQEDVYRQRRETARAKEFDQNVEWHMDASRAAYRMGEPLSDLKELEMMGTQMAADVRKEVLRRRKAEFGWETGPKPAPVAKAAPKPSVAPPPAAEEPVDYSEVFGPTPPPAERVERLEAAIEETLPTELPHIETAHDILHRALVQQRAPDAQPEPPAMQPGDSPAQLLSGFVDIPVDSGGNSAEPLIERVSVADETIPTISETIDANPETPARDTLPEPEF